MIPFLVAFTKRTLRPPMNTVAPVVSGLTPAGSLLTTTDGTWTNTPTGYTYQWQADGVDIVGETANTYTTVVGDVGKAIRCGVVASNADGAGTVAYSNAITVTAAPVYALWDTAYNGLGNFVFSSGDHAVQMGGVHGSSRSTIGKTTGKHYWEITCGPQNPTASIGVQLGTGDYNAKWTGEGGSLGTAIAGNTVRANGTPAPPGTTATAPGTVVGVLLDLDAGTPTVDFQVNGVAYGGGPIALGGYSGGATLYASCGTIGANNPLVTANFGDTPFAYPVPSGYRAGLYN